MHLRQDVIVKSILALNLLCTTNSVQTCKPPVSLT